MMDNCLLYNSQAEPGAYVGHLARNFGPIKPFEYIWQFIRRYTYPVIGNIYYDVFLHVINSDRHLAFILAINYSVSNKVQKHFLQFLIITQNRVIIFLFQDL